MFLTGAGLPAGYGYSKIASVAGENIYPALIQHLRQEDENDNDTPIIIYGMKINVAKACTVSINGRQAVTVTPEEPLRFNCRGITSIVFKESGIMYDITVSY